MKKTLLTFLLLSSISLSVKAQDWHSDFEEVKKLATVQNKSILLVFKGSDWCAPCIKLDKNIFSSVEFVSNYKSDFVLLEADFPRKKKNVLSKELQAQNNKLAEQYNKNGHFPLVLVLNTKGEVLGTTGYNKLSPDAYLQSLIGFTR